MKSSHGGLNGNHWGGTTVDFVEEVMVQVDMHGRCALLELDEIVSVDINVVKALGQGGC